jgi:hypothetical protein
VYYPHRGFDHGNKQKEKTNSKLKTQREEQRKRAELGIY